MPSIGTMTDRVQLQRRVTSDESEGGELAGFTPIATVWARVRQLSTRQAFASDARGQNVSLGVTIRHRTDLKAGDRIVWRGRELSIQALDDINGARAYLSCQCVERVVSG